MSPAPQGLCSHRREDRRQCQALGCLATPARLGKGTQGPTPSSPALEDPVLSSVGGRPTEQVAFVTTGQILPIFRGRPTTLAPEGLEGSPESPTPPACSGVSFGSQLMTRQHSQQRARL